MLDFILLQAPSGGQSLYGNLLLIGGIVLIFYFFMIRPQQKKQKDQKRFLEEVKKGDNIVTVGGIHGRIAAMDGETIILEVEKGGKIKLDKSSISLEASKRYKGGK
ncbi:MAG: preprotein translocase subunit YajC [Cyclobacteriaceae bacterium]|jgi:preprotein translocase subunit YajC